MPDLIVVEGFEHGVAANGTGGNVYQAVNGTPSIVASHRGAGARAMRFAPGAGAVGTVSIDHTASATVVFVGYLWLQAISVLGSTRRIVLGMQSGATIIANLSVHTVTGNTKLSLATTDSSTNLVIGQSYRIEIRITIAGGNYTADWKIDGVDQTQVVNATGQTTFSRLRVGPQLAGTDDITLDWDDIGISATSGDYPIGDIEVVSLAPSTLDIAGSTSPTKFNTDSGIDPVAGDSSLLADAPITGGLTTYIAQDTIDGAAFIEVEFADPVGTPLGAAASGAFVNVGGASATYEARARSTGGTETTLVSGSKGDTGAGGAFVRAFLPIPAGGWTAAELSAYVVRFGYATDVTPNPRWSAFSLSYARVPISNNRSGAGRLFLVLADRGAGAKHAAGAGRLSVPSPLRSAGAKHAAGAGRLSVPALLRGAGAKHATGAGRLVVVVVLTGASVPAPIIPEPPAPEPGLPQLPEPIGVYTYLAADIVSNRVVGELPLSGVRFSRLLDGAGSLSATLPLQAANTGRTGFGEGPFGEGDFGGPGDLLDPVVRRALLSTTEPERIAVYIDRDGRLVWGGPIWTRRYTSSSKALELGGNTFWSLFRRRKITETITYVGDDQFDIVKDLINYTQAKGDLAIVIGAEVSGVVRDRTYFGYEYKEIGEAIEQLAAVEDGFDFAIDVAYDTAHEPQRLLVLSYPLRGRTDAPFVFEYPGNIVDYDWPEDASAAADTMYALGTGEGAAMLVATATDEGRIAAGYPLLEDSRPYKDVSIQSTLDEHAAADLEAAAEPVTLPKLTVRADRDPVLGSYAEGDYCRIRIDDLRHERLDEVWRILDLDVTVGPPESVSLTLGPVA